MLGFSYSFISVIIGASVLCAVGTGVRALPNCGPAPMCMYCNDRGSEFLKSYAGNLDLPCDFERGTPLFATNPNTGICANAEYVTVSKPKIVDNTFDHYCLPAPTGTQTFVTACLARLSIGGWGRCTGILGKKDEGACTPCERADAEECVNGQENCLCANSPTGLVCDANLYCDTFTSMCRNIPCERDIGCRCDATGACESDLACDSFGFCRATQAFVDATPGTGDVSVFEKCWPASDPDQHPRGDPAAGRWCQANEFCCAPGWFTGKVFDVFASADYYGPTCESESCSTGIANFRKEATEAADNTLGSAASTLTASATLLAAIATMVAVGC